jgi:hypothetical protein
MVDALLDDLATELRQRVEVKLAAARVEFERRFSSETSLVRSTLMTSLVRSTLIKQIENARSWQIRDDSRPYECPACGSGALVHGTNRNSTTTITLTIPRPGWFLTRTASFARSVTLSLTESTS